MCGWQPVVGCKANLHPASLLAKVCMGDYEWNNPTQLNPFHTFSRMHWCFIFSNVYRTYVKYTCKICLIRGITVITFNWFCTFNSVRRALQMHEACEANCLQPRNRPFKSALESQPSQLEVTYSDITNPHRYLRRAHLHINFYRSFKQFDV